MIAGRANRLVLTLAEIRLLRFWVPGRGGRGGGIDYYYSYVLKTTFRERTTVPPSCTCPFVRLECPPHERWELGSNRERMVFLKQSRTKRVSIEYTASHYKAGGGEYRVSHV